MFFKAVTACSWVTSSRQTLFTCAEKRRVRTDLHSVLYLNASINALVSHRNDDDAVSSFD